MEAVLSSHCGSHVIRPAELEHLPPPKPMGPMHRPVPHHELAGILKEELEEAGFNVTREEYAVQRRGLKLFGVMDMVTQPGISTGLFNGDKGLGLGFRHGNDQSMSLRLVAGAVLVVMKSKNRERRTLPLCHTAGAGRCGPVQGATAFGAQDPGDDAALRASLAGESQGWSGGLG